MLISPALAHGIGGGGTAVGPLILLGVGVVCVLVYVGRKAWRRRAVPAGRRHPACRCRCRGAVTRRWNRNTGGLDMS